MLLLSGVVKMSDSITRNTDVNGMLMMKTNHLDEVIIYLMELCCLQLFAATEDGPAKWCS